MNCPSSFVSNVFCNKRASLRGRFSQNLLQFQWEVGASVTPFGLLFHTQTFTQIFNHKEAHTANWWITRPITQLLLERNPKNLNLTWFDGINGRWSNHLPGAVFVAQAAQRHNEPGSGCPGSEWPTQYLLPRILDEPKPGPFYSSWDMEHSSQQQTTQQQIFTLKQWIKSKKLTFVYQM